MTQTRTTPETRRWSIGLDDFDPESDFDAALAAFYEEVLSSEAVRGTGVGERAIRDWVDGQLITRDGYRLPTLSGPAGPNGDAVLGALDKALLIRTDERNDKTYYELAHDRLVGPVQASNVAWRTEHLESFQIQAKSWSELPERQQEEMLLRGEDLADATRYRESEPAALNDTDRRFLERSEEAEARRAEEEARRAQEEARRKRNRLIAGAVGVVLVVAVVGVVALLARQGETDAQRRDAERRARAGQLAATSRILQSRNPALALAVAAESTQTTDDPIAEAQAALVGARVELREGSWQAVLGPIEQVRAREVAINGDGLIASGGCAPECPKDAEGKIIGTTDTIYLRPASDPATSDVLGSHAARLNDLAFSPDDELLASTAKDGVVRIWDVDTRQPTGDEFRPPPSGPVLRERAFVHSVAFHPVDSGLLAMGDNRGRVWLWDLDGEPVQLDRAGVGAPLVIEDRAELERVFDVEDVAFSPDGRTVASAESTGNVVLWDVASERATSVRAYPLTDDEEERKKALRLQYHPDPEFDLLVVGHEQGAIWRWEDPLGDAPTARLIEGHTEDVRGLTFGDQGLLATSSGDFTIRLWDFERQPDQSIETVEVRELTDHDGFVSDVAFTPEERRLVSTSRDELRLWGVPQQVGVTVLGAPLECAGGGDCFATSVAFGRGDRLASTGFDGVIRLWSPDATAKCSPPGASSCRPDEELEGIGPMYAVAAHPEEDMLVAGGHGRVWAWTGGALEPLWEAPGRQLAAWQDLLADPNADDDDLKEARDRVPAVRAVAVDGSSRFAASADECGDIRIWDVAAGEEVDVLNTVEGRCPERPKDGDRSVDALAFGDGVLMFGSEPGPVWEVPFDGETGLLDEASQTMHDHGGNVRGVDLSTDLLASGGRDQEVQLSRRSEDREPLHLVGHTREVGAVAFGDSLLASASNDGTIRFWWVEPSSAGFDVVPATGEPLLATKQ